MNTLSRAVRWGLLLTVLTVTPGCGLLKRRAKPSPPSALQEVRAGLRPVGTVSLLNESSGFLLIQSPVATIVGDKTMLVTRDGAGERTGKLVVTPERKRNFLAADIAEGKPKRGELVFFPSEKKVTSLEVPTAGELGGEGGTVGAMPVAATGGTRPPATIRQEDLPPLGQPSGPLEELPELPDAPGAQ